MRADARRNRLRILAAAREAFAEGGLDCQVDDVARRAGVGVGTLYRHFPTKDALLRAMADDHFERMETLLHEVEAEPDAWEAFAGFVWRAAEMMAADRGLAQVLAERPEAMGEAAQARAGLQPAVEALVARGKKAKVLRADFEWSDVPMMMCVLGHAVQAQGPNMNLDRYVTLLLDGVRAKGTTPLPTPASG
jgi:AcrR family transcriptional regulator